MHTVGLGVMSIEVGKSFEDFFKKWNDCMATFGKEIGGEMCLSICTGLADHQPAFRYTSSKIRIDETQLTDEMVKSKSFHMVCSPERCINLIQGIKLRRQELNSPEDAIFVWEPVPDSCDIGALEAVRRAALCVNIISPNLSELAALFGEDEGSSEQDERMEERCLAILEGDFGNQGGAVIVRCGSRGCYLRSKTERRSLPAYWTGPESREHVIDPTGGGNQFLGGLCIGLQSDGPAGFSKLGRGAILGNIAASFAVEQVGVPKLSKGPSNIELWNGDSVEDRLSRYIDRLA